MCFQMWLWQVGTLVECAIKCVTGCGRLGLLLSVLSDVAVAGWEPC